MLAPGEYHFPTGVILKNFQKHGVTIKGTGQQPQDVIIKSTIVIGSGINVSFSNLSINALHEKNAVNISENSTVNFKRVIVNGELTGNYPPIHCIKSTINFEASEVYFSEERIDSIFLSEQSTANIRSSIIS